MSRKSARTRVRQLACLGLPGGLFIASVVPVIRVSTRSEAAAFFWLDAEGRVVNVYADRLPLSAGEAPASAAVVGRDACCLPPVERQVQTACVDSEQGAEGLYGQIVRENSAFHILHGVPTANGVAIGRLSLFRSRGERGFGARETAEVASIMRYVSHGITSDASALDESWGTTAEDALEQAMVLVNRNGRLIQATESARRLLLLSTGCRLASDTMDRAVAACQVLLRALCEGKTAGRPQMSRDTMWGRFILRAYRLGEVRSDESPIGVHIKHVRPKCLRFVSAMSEMPLSPQQREIALMIAKGSSNREIAMRLAVTGNTVAYHIKQLFLKLNVHDRAGLLARIGADMGPDQLHEAPQPDISSVAG